MSVGVWSSMSVVGWTPLLQPLPVGVYWMWFLLPLAAAIAVVYKTLKLPDLAQLPREALLMTTEIVVGLAATAAVLWLVGLLM